MQADMPKLVIGLLIAAFVIFRIYGRVRSSIGRQALRPAPIVIRAAVLSTACAFFLVSPLMSEAGFAWAGAGALAGFALGAYALMHTKVEATPEGRFYTGHPIIGLLVTGLLIVRIGFRMVQAYAAISAASAPPRGANPFASTFASPTTLAAFFLTMGYYVLYGAGLLAKARKASLSGGGSPEEVSLLRSGE